VSQTIEEATENLKKVAVDYYYAVRAMRGGLIQAKQYSIASSRLMIGALDYAEAVQSIAKAPVLDKSTE
jgi:hypothetical protein